MRYTYCIYRTECKFHSGYYWCHAYLSANGTYCRSRICFATYDFILLKKSFKNLIIATGVSLFVSSLYFYLSPFKEVQSELLARTSPLYMMYSSHFWWYRRCGFHYKSRERKSYSGRCHCYSTNASFVYSRLWVGNSKLQVSGGCFIFIQY